MRSRRAVLLLLGALLSLQVCFAHPMGNFSVNHYTKLTLEQDGVRVEYFIDEAEIPTYQELQQANIAQAEPAAAAAFVAAKGAELERGLSLRFNGTPVALQMITKAVLFPAGAGGLPTMKLGYVFHAAYPAGLAASTATLSYTDANFAGHAGWKELVIVGPAARLLSSTAPQTDRSDELSNYPTDMLNSPPQMLSATARLLMPPGPAGPGAPVALPAAAPAHTVREATMPGPGMMIARQASRRTQPASTVPALRQKLAPGAAAWAGRPTPSALPQAAAQSPLTLHGNRQPTARDAFTQLVTAQHLSLWFLLTAAFISIGLGALHALEPGHGKTIVAAYLVGSQGTARHAVLLGLIVTAAHTASVFALGGITLYASRYILPEQLYPWLGVLSGMSIALLGAYMFLRRWTGQEVEHSHTSAARHGHWFSGKQPVDPGDMPAVPAKAFSLSQLFLLGITGGIIPCPAALVVLLSALALHRVGFGFFLITAFSAGLAAVLIAFGLLMVYARNFMRRFQVDGEVTRRWLPVASAAFMTILGASVALRAFGSTGVSLAGLTHHKVGPALLLAGLGLLLGIRHSTDTDHVVAISTIVTRQRGIRGAALIGGMWGLGHTITIFVVGCLIILFGITIPTRIGLSMEFSVGLMLILLGVLNLTGLMPKAAARLSLAGGSAQAAECAAPHVVPQSDTRRPGRLAATVSSYGAYQCLRPLAIGLVHGLAGSAAVALLVLSTIHSPVWAVLYLVIFGGGTLLGMVCMTAAMALPLAYAGNRMPSVSRYIGIASGLVSVCFGTFLVYQLGFVAGLFTSHPHWTPQ